MPLAHGGETGANFEALVLAVPMVILGVVFFIQKSTKPMVPIVLVLGGIAIGAAGLTVLASDDHDAEGSKVAATNSYVGAVTGLCEARAVASTEPDEATRFFRDEAHVDLHALAAQVGEEDRAAAAALLEAKQAVEADLDASEVNGQTLVQELDELLEATVAALRAIDIEAPTC